MTSISLQVKAKFFEEYAGEYAKRGVSLDTAPPHEFSTMLTSNFFGVGPVSLHTPLPH
jgi:hypothetical protein